MIVRKINWAGPCIEQGQLIRETREFYVYGGNGAREGRVKKALVHLEPCTRCMDHPKTTYPRGFDL